MKQPIVIIGMGEMGGVFARGLLRIGHPVYPVTRGMSLQSYADELAGQNIDPVMVLVAVAEKDLDATLAALPAAWKNKIALLQNELLPKDWQPYGLQQPTVISVWFEKKPGQDAKILIPSPVYGPNAAILHDALQALSIDCRILKSAQELLEELILKNIYIVTTNVCGLRTGGNVGQLWQNHQDFARNIAFEVMDIQEALTGTRLDRDAMIEKMLVAFAGDLEHQCMGRSAPARLERALASADHLGLALPALQQVQSGA